MRLKVKSIVFDTSRRQTILHLTLTILKKHISLLYLYTIVAARRDKNNNNNNYNSNNYNYNNYNYKIIIVMDRVEADLTPGEDWRESLNATCNRLSTQYLNLLRAASSMSSLEQKGGINNNNGNNNKGAGSSSNFGSGSQKMTSLQDPPPPPLAADIGSSSLQCQLAVENLCVASSQLLSLIRTLRLSILMMDEETIAAEEEWQVLEVQKITNQAQNEANKLEQEWMELRNQEFAVVDDDNNNN